MVKAAVEIEESSQPVLTFPSERLLISDHDHLLSPTLSSLRMFTVQTGDETAWAVHPGRGTYLRCEWEKKREFKEKRGKVRKEGEVQKKTSRVQWGSPSQSGRWRAVAPALVFCYSVRGVWLSQSCGNMIRSAPSDKLRLTVHSPWVHCH